MQSLPKPTLNWDITKICNYKCSYCFDTEKKIEDCADPMALLDKILENLKGSWEFQIGGVGEPFLAPNFLEIIGEIIKGGHTVNVVTNFSAPLEKIIKFCEIAGSGLVCLSASLHLEQADVDEFLEKAVKINKIIRNKFNVSSVARKGRVQELKVIEDRFVKEGIKFFMRLERDREIFTEYDDQEKEILKNNRGVWADKNILGYKGKLCWAGSKYVVINEKGDVWRCYPSIKGKLEPSLGNLLQGTFKLNEAPLACRYEYCTCATPVLKDMVAKNNIKYSVVIPAYNRSQFLSETLVAVLNQTIFKDQYEIIIIDDGSTDDTREVADRFIKNNPQANIVYFYQSNQGCAKARNTGILHSRGEIIFFTDDDCIAPDDWMEKILSAFARYPEAVGVGGWYEPTDDIFEKNKYYQFFRFLVRQAYPGMEYSEIYTNTTNSPAGNTANMAYKKSALMKIGLFDEGINFTGCVDWELKLRMIFFQRYPMAYIPLNVTHRKKMTFKEFFFKSLRQGRGRDYCQKKYPQLKNQSYYNQSIWNLIKDFQLWSVDFEKKIFRGIYFLHLFAGLCGKYVNRILGFKPVYEFVQACQTEKIFHHTLLPDKKIIKEESVPYDHEKMCADFIGAETSGDCEPYFSVVVATFNRKKLILKTLNSLVSQTIPSRRYEIIVVDDGSTDGSDLYVKQFINSHKEYEIKYILQKNSGPAVARNRGAREARGKILVFTDDDCFAPADWLERMDKIYEIYPEISGVGGWLVTPWSNSSIFDKYQKAKNPAGDKERYQKLFFTNSPRKNLVFNTANLSLKKEAFFEIGGINEVFRTPGFEDFDLGLRILEKGFTVAYMPYPVIHLKCLNLKSCIALAKNRYHNYVLFLREKEKFPENCLQNHTLSGLVVRFADIFISPSYNRIAEFIEYATRLQVAIQKNINMENFFRKSYKIDADSKK